MEVDALVSTIEIDNLETIVSFGAEAAEGISRASDVVLNSTVTVVDASKCKMYMRNFGEFFNNQIQYAGTIVLSRTDKVGEEKAVQSVELLRQVNETSPVVTTPISMLEGKKLPEQLPNF